MGRLWSRIRLADQTGRLVYAMDWADPSLDERFGWAATPGLREALSRGGATARMGRIPSDGEGKEWMVVHVPVPQIGWVATALIPAADALNESRRALYGEVSIQAALVVLCTGAALILAHRPVPIILATAHSDPDLIQQAMVAGVMGSLLKPVDRKDLVPAIALATTRFVDLMALRKDVQSLKEPLMLRQQVERAKGIIERRMGFSEDEAHKRIQHLARHERCSLGEAAAKVITADKFFAELEGMA